MIKFSINGKILDCENVDIIINHDYIKNKTSLTMYNGEDELTFDDNTADFDINIDISSKALDIEKMAKDNRDFDTSISTIQRANMVIKHELEYLVNQKEVSTQMYKSLCDSIMKKAYSKN